MLPLPTRAHPSLRGIWFWRGLGIGLALAPALGWPVILPLGALLRAVGVPILAAYVAAGLIAWVSYVVGLWVWTRLAYGRLRFEVSPQEIRIEKGVFVRAVTRIPMSRVRHVTVRRGPLLRMRGLGTVRIEVVDKWEATPHAPDGQLPGLREAEEVAAWILRHVPATRPTTAARPTTASASVPRRTRPSG